MFYNTFYKRNRKRYEAKCYNFTDIKDSAAKSISVFHEFAARHNLSVWHRGNSSNRRFFVVCVNPSFRIKKINPIITVCYFFKIFVKFKFLKVVKQCSLWALAHKNEKDGLKQIRFQELYNTPDLTDSLQIRKKMKNLWFLEENGLAYRFCLRGRFNSERWGKDPLAAFVHR